MKKTTVLVSTNCHRDGFFTGSMIKFGDGLFFSHMVNDKVKAFNMIDKEGVEVDRLHYVNKEFFKILSIGEVEV